MSRKDTILVAVIINAGLLAVLFATAIIYDTDQIVDQTEFESALAEAPPINNDFNSRYLQEEAPLDEIDQEIENLNPSVLAAVKEEELYFPETEVKEVKVEKKETVKEEPKQKEEQKPLMIPGQEIVVKKGDSLDKLAKIHHTTVKAIKEHNHLSSEKLSIGQVLKMPYSDKKKTAALKTTSSSLQASSNAVYHVVKSGESPWKIAKQYGVNYEQILKFNHLDEEKARNLKIGDRIRVK